MGDQCATQAAPGSAFTAIRSVMICALQGNRSDINKATSPVQIIILLVANKELEACVSTF